MSCSNLIVEVETDASIDNAPTEAESQLAEFGLAGYRSVLVVPSTDSDAVSDFEQRINDNLDGHVYVETPSSVTRLL